MTARLVQVLAVGAIALATLARVTLASPPDFRRSAKSADQALTADGLVKRVLAENAGLASLRAAVDAARARIVPAGALPDPQASVDVAPRTVGGFDAPPGVDDNARISWSISQAFPWPGTLDLRAAAARKEAAAVTEGVADLRLRLVAATKSAYAQWRYVHRASAINETNQDLVDELRRVAEQRYAAGVGRQQDVLQAEVELQRLKRQALTLERLERAVRAKINALLNRSANHALTLAQALPAPQALPTYSVLRDVSLASHPELTQIQRRIAANKDREALARKDFYPKFKLFAGSRGVMDPAAKRLYVGVGLSLPLNRGKYNARLDAAQADTVRLESALAERRAQLLSQLEQAYAAVEEARGSIALYEDKLVPLARENLSAARAEYGAGGGSFLNVIDAEKSELDAKLNLARVRADYFAARAELAHWVGGSLPKAATAAPSAADSDHE